SVEHIGGLQPFLQAHKHAKCRIPKHPVATAAAAKPKKNAAPKPPYLVKDILKAYDADAVTADGTHQVIAIMIDTFPDDQDVSAFWTASGLPNNLQRIQKIN